ncbi:hypothetical protein CgunFtcFv8_021063 [Champsocephalus gunnari]|uniref:Uncharacterized protein n=1 Tax=Champsocephalus gunnari TaxID=52237 RepID=A0AAN8I1R6_CHAGU|nr:hypothetical protein CgunFtcFv8_021063 [Champsocephalus gunnari]
MRLKPDAILLQTDGHRKPPRSELSPPICCFYSRSILEVHSGVPKTALGCDFLLFELASRASTQTQYEPKRF